MIRPTLRALALLCGAMPMAMAGPVILGPAEMDKVTAGASTGGGALAFAAGPFAFTGTSATAIATKDTMNGQPTLTGYAAGSEAVGTATATGPGAVSGTAATTSAAVPGTVVTTYTITANQQVGGTSISGSATMAFGSFAGPSVF